MRTPWCARSPIPRSSRRCASARRFRNRVVDRLPKLKLLITTGMRNASFDMAALKDRGVTVCGTGGPGGGNEDTAELAWGLILGAARRIAEDHQLMRQGGWQTRDRPPRRRQDARACWASAGSAARSPGSGSPSA